MDEAIKAQIEEAINKYVKENGESFELFADYKDELSDSTIKEIFNSESPVDKFYGVIEEGDWFESADYEYDYIIEDQLELPANIKSEYYDEIKQMLTETVSYSLPYEHFNTDVYFDVFLNNPEGANVEYSDEMLQYEEEEDLEENKVIGVNSEIKKIIELQGYNVDDFIAFANGEGNENTFFKSLLTEIENCTYDTGNQIVFLVQAPLLDMAQALQYKQRITIPSDATCGLFNSINGSGSDLDIVLDKDIDGTIGSDLIVYYKDGYEYNVDDTYGLIASVWEHNVRFNKNESISSIVKNLNKIIETVNSSKLFSLDDKIAPIENKLVKLRNKMQSLDTDDQEGAKISKEIKDLENKLKKLNDKRDKALSESIDNINVNELQELRIQKLDDNKYSLDGTEFYLGEDEELENAIDICLEEDILPKVQQSNKEITSYTIEEINMQENDNFGYVQVIFN